MYQVLCRAQTRNGCSTSKRCVLKRVSEGGGGVITYSRRYNARRTMIARGACREFPAAGRQLASSWRTCVGSPAAQMEWVWRSREFGQSASAHFGTLDRFSLTPMIFAEPFCPPTPSTIPHRRLTFDCGSSCSDGLASPSCSPGRPCARRASSMASRTALPPLLRYGTIRWHQPPVYRGTSPWAPTRRNHANRIRMTVDSMYLTADRVLIPACRLLELLRRRRSFCYPNERGRRRLHHPRPRFHGLVLPSLWTCCLCFDSR